MDRDLQACILTAIFWLGVVLALVKVFVPSFLFLFLYILGILFANVLLIILISSSFSIFKRLISTLHDFFSNARSHH